MSQCRIAPSLGAFEHTPDEIWGTTPYVSEEEPTVFFGLYGLNDFHALWRHKGKKWILWAGSDIRHFVNGYWLDEKGEIRFDPKPMAEWIQKNCESYVENEIEQEELAKMGVYAKVVPSFLGYPDEYPVSYTYKERPSLYASVSGNDFSLYGWHLIEGIAPLFPGVDFHLYGNSIPWETNNKNVIVHGRVPAEEMNREIQTMQGGIRPVMFDGFSEILAKSLLWGQWPVSFIRYPHVIDLDEIGDLLEKKEPNTEGRAYYVKHLNQYPWNIHV